MNLRKKMSITTFYSFLKIALLATACSKGNSNAPAVPEKPEPPVELIEVEDCQRCLVLAEQSKNRIAIVDVNTANIIWEWTAVESNVLTPHIAWFNLPDEAKPVYGGRYILMTASGGGVALIRIKDKKTLFYANVGGNPHSAEILPDGNIVTSSSTGNRLTLLHVDTLAYPNEGFKRVIAIDDGHNVVWDNTRKVLWATSNTVLKAFAYNNNCQSPDLSEVETINIPGPGTNAHDLFPVYGEDAMFVSTTTNVYKFNLVTQTFSMLDTELQYAIKSISSGPDGFPVILIQPKREWYTDEVKDTDGRSIFQQNDLRIYKARWLVDNAFSYPQNHAMRQCE